VPTPADLNEIPARPVEPPNDWLPLVDAALARMSERDRGPILLCDLLGRSRAEAAAELGVGEGTLSSRLARARAKLRLKLARLGVVPGVLTMAALAPEPVPAALIESTRTAASTAARELAEGVLRTMFLANVMKFSTVGLCLVGAAAGVVWLPVAGAGPVPVTQETPKPTPPAKEEAKPESDLARIQGTWVVESIKSDQDLHPMPWLGLQFVFDGTRVVSSPLPGEKPTIRLDPNREPKQIDFLVHNAPRSVGRGGRRITVNEDQTWPAIYEFAGEKLKLAIGDVELQERPTSFDEPKKGSPFALLVLRRPTKGDLGRLLEEELLMLRGRWVAVSETTRGGRRPASADVKLIIRGDRLRFDAPGGSLHGSFVLGLAAHPRRLDVTAAEDWGAVKKGAVVPGIYARAGYELTLALGASTRPPSFDAAAQDGIVYTFVREDHLADVKETPPPPWKDGPAPQPVNKRLRELQAERVKALEEQLRAQMERVKTGQDLAGSYIAAAQELAEAEKDIAETPAAKRAAIERLVATLTMCAKQAEAMQKAGVSTQAAALQAKAALLKAEIELEKLKESK
jgi:uncharacterized protein (TIGR03067 family)